MFGYCLLLGPCLCFVPFLCLDLYVLWEGAMVGWCLSCRPGICVSWSASGLEVGLAPWGRFGPSSRVFCWPFLGGASFMYLLCILLSCVFCAFVRVCLFVPCGHLLGKGWPLGSRLWGITVSLSLSHWYPVSGVVLDIIDSWSLYLYLHSCKPNINYMCLVPQLS